MDRQQIIRLIVEGAQIVTRQSDGWNAKFQLTEIEGNIMENIRKWQPVGESNPSYQVENLVS
jgi:hypothetical protein